MKSKVVKLLNWMKTSYTFSRWRTYFMLAP